MILFEIIWCGFSGGGLRSGCSGGGGWKCGFSGGGRRCGNEYFNESILL